MKSRPVVLTGLFLTLLAAGPGQAAPPSQKQVAVSYGELNLGKAEGVATLDRRIRNAARNVCGPEPDIKMMDAYRNFNACVEQSTKRALAALPQSARMADAVATR